MHYTIRQTRSRNGRNKHENHTNKSKQIPFLVKELESWLEQMEALGWTSTVFRFRDYKFMKHAIKACVECCQYGQKSLLVAVIVCI